MHKDQISSEASFEILSLEIDIWNKEGSIFTAPFVYYDIHVTFTIVAMSFIHKESDST